MKCGIDCVQFIERYYHLQMKSAISYLKKQISEKGISIYDMLKALSNYNAKAYKSIFLPKKTPAILYLKGNKTGHFIVLIQKNTYSLTIYDPVFKVCKINKIMMYLQWTHIYIKIDNVN